MLGGSTWRFGAETENFPNINLVIKVFMYYLRISDRQMFS